MWVSLYQFHLLQPVCSIFEESSPLLSYFLLSSYAIDLYVSSPLLSYPLPSYPLSYPFHSYPLLSSYSIDLYVPSPLVSSPLVSCPLLSSSLHVTAHHLYYSAPSTGAHLHMIIKLFHLHVPFFIEGLRHQLLDHQLSSGEDVESEADWFYHTGGVREKEQLASKWLS